MLMEIGESASFIFYFGREKGKTDWKDGRLPQ